MQNTYGTGQQIIFVIKVKGYMNFKMFENDTYTVCYLYRSIFRLNELLIAAISQMKCSINRIQVENST